VIQNRHFLSDCGEAAQMQLMRYQLQPQKIDHIFISHLHGDHYLGLMGLLLSMHLQKRVSDLHVYSPKGLDEIIQIQLKYSKSTLGYHLYYHVFDPEKVETLWEDQAVSVATIPLSHKLPCAGFLFREKRKPRRIDKGKLPPDILLQQIATLKAGQDVTDEEGHIIFPYKDYTLEPRKSLAYAFCSDTAFHKPIIEQISGVDLLYHEATFMDIDMDKAVETKHSTAKQAAHIALAAGVDQLIIGHFSARYKDLAPVLAEAKSVFPNTRLAVEGDIFEIQS
jgi:ribonuclease Z